MTVSEQVTRVRELVKKLEKSGDCTEKTAYVLGAVTDALDAIASSLASLQDQIHENADFIDEVDSDLSDLEDYVYGNEAEDGESDDEFSFEYEIECPSCGGKMIVTEEDDVWEVVCPNCGSHFSALAKIDLEDEDAEDDDDALPDDLGDMSPGDDDEETPDENTMWL